MGTGPLPGPPARAVPGFAAQLIRDPLVAYDGLWRRYGPVVRIPYARGKAFYLLTGPEYVEHVLVARQANYVKAFTYRPLKAYLGDGLLTSEGATWQRHRAVVQPVFSRRHVEQFDTAIVDVAHRWLDPLTPGQVIDVPAWLRTVTMGVIGRVLFGTDLAADAGRVGEALTRLQGAMMLSVLLPGRSAGALRRMGRLVPRLGGAASVLEDLVDRIIAERRGHPSAEPRDLLDRLIAGGGDEPFDEEELRAEVLTLVLAGHETTANTLAWTLVLLSRHPEARERLEGEVDQVLSGRDPTADDLAKLEWTGAVIDEAMRLYPPAWTIERDALADDDVCGVPVPAGSTVITSPYLLHRDPRFWPSPSVFDPARFIGELPHERPRHAFLPFGAGRRICVGSGLARLEATLVLATLASRLRLDLAPETVVRHGAGVTLYPKGRVPMTVSHRPR